MLKHSLFMLLLASAAVPVYATDQAEPPPKELVEYVREARNAGLKDSVIQENAVKAGWSGPVVNEAIAATSAAAKARNESPSPAPSPSAAPESSSVAPPASAPAVKPAVTNHGVSDDYIIGAGDVLQINVWKEPDASVSSAVVRPEGKISMPLLKEVSVVGLTPTQAEHSIAQQLSKFINGADVTIVVSAINSKKIYVVGAVKKEGPIPYTYRMSIMQALSEAGGLTDYAKRKKIYVLRNENGRDFRLPFDYEAVLKGEHMELNIPLLPGDTLVVPH